MSLLSQLTLEEKAALCLGSTFWHTAPLPRLGIPAIMVADGPHGLRRQPDGNQAGISGSLPATCFPTASALGSSWDPDLVRRVGEAIGAEARTQGVAVVLGPGVNIKRSPLCGRNFEYFAEDPLLTGVLGEAYINGIQSQGVGACVKHFAANNQETDRLRVSADVDERTLREIYLPHFERIVTRARPWMVMCAYNRVNGVHASQNPWLLTEVLRDEWGFDGVVVSDWGAVHDRVAALAAGLDLEMPPNLGVSDTALVAAVREGSLDEAVLDRAVDRMLRLIDRAPKDAQPDAFDDAAHHALAREVAADCAVLLKNDGGLLPLQPSDETVVAVIGKFACEPRFQGAGSSQVNPTRVDAPLDELRAAGLQVEFSTGEDPAEAVALARRASTVVLFLGLAAGDESEGADREHLDLPAAQTALVGHLAEANPRLVVVLANGSAVRMTPWDRHAPAILETWLSGQAAGGAVADLLVGASNPSGRLAETLPLRLQDVPSYLNFPGEQGHVRYGEGVFVGYRGYDAVGRKVAYPFGHGLSYTTFEYRDLVVGPGIATVTVINTGERRGKEVAQLYIAAPSSRVARPIRQLKGLAKVDLAPGEATTVTFTLDERDLSYWSPADRRWVLEGGSFEISIGASSRDLRVAATLDVPAPPVRPRLDADATLREWLADPDGAVALRQAIGHRPDGAANGILGDDETLTVLGDFPLRVLTVFPGLGIDRPILDKATAGHRPRRNLMSPIRRPLTLLTTAFLLTLGAAVPASAHSGSGGDVRVARLSVDGRYDSPLGLDNVRPTLAWQMSQIGDCRQRVCAADRQTAYEIQAAATVADLHAGRLLWRTGRVDGDSQQARFGRDLRSRDTVAWRVRVWDAHRKQSAWSTPSTWTTGLLDPADWGAARWIDYPDRAENQPMPIFARPFAVPRHKKVADARLYLSGVGLHHATVNGREITDEVLAPGNSNYQLSSEYRTYDLTSVLRSGANALGVELGHGPAYVRRSVTNPAVGRTAPYSWWQSQLKGGGTLTADAPAGSSSVEVSAVTGYHVGGTVNIDTGGGGDRLESRVITAIGATSITFTPALTSAHAAGAKVTGSGNNIAASDASAGAAVTPRFIGRLEIRYRDGSTETIVTDRSWRTALGPLVTDAWYAGSDYDARREQPGWNVPGADLSATAKRRDGTATGWINAGLAPPPNLATKLVARTAEPIVAQEEFSPVAMSNPVPGTWVFDFGQNIVGWPRLKLDRLPAGTTVKVAPAESLNLDGTVNQASLMGGGGSRGVDLFNTYTTAGGRSETWLPQFNYFGMQWVQVTGLPSGFTPTKDLITGVRLQADTPVAGTFASSNARVNRVHTMSRYSFAANIMSVFTDCPGREKLSYPADYTMPMGAIHRDFQLNAFMRTTMRHLVEGQSLADTPMAGNVALKTPVYDWGYSGRFGDEINWGNAIVLVPAILHQLYGDTATMGASYDRLVRFVDYLQRQKVGTGENAYIVDAALADWVSAEPVSGRITGTWGYYLTIQSMARIATLTGHTADATRYTALAEQIKTAFNRAFFNEALGRYTATGNAGADGATQTAQALALDAGLVPDDSRGKVLDALVELIYAFHPNGAGPHLSGGTIGMGPIVRALMNGDRDDVLWEVLQQNDQPSYGYFLESTPANPGGMTTVGERWNRGDSKNHMILAQIEEWFHAGIAGIQAAPGSLAYDRLVFKPKPVGDLTKANGSYETPAGWARSAWTKKDGTFALSVTVPANTQAEVWVPAADRRAVTASGRAVFQRVDGAYVVYTVASGSHSFTARAGA